MKTSPRTSEMHFLGGVFLTCMCGLMLQIMQTRILSIVSYYHMAFFAIGMAMMGMTAGALLVYYDRLPKGRSLPATLSGVLVAFAWTALLSLLALTSVSLSSRFEPTLRFVGAWVVGIAVLLPPYVLLGAAVSLALTRSPFPVTRVYGTDLVGAAAGCIVTLFLLRATDTYSAVILVGALGGVAAWLFQRADEQLAGTQGELLPPGRPWWQAPAATAVVIGAVGLANSLAGTYGLRPVLVKGQTEQTFKLSEERWNSFSRVTLQMSERSPAFFWSRSSAAPDVQLEQGWLKIDGEAGTPIYKWGGDLKDLEFLKYDATALAYHIRHQGRSAVIGVGGGRDVLTAAAFGFRDITGVEYNPIFIDLISRDYLAFSGRDHVPGLKLNVDDARSWFARSDEHFDLIQMSLIDTWAATGAGAFSLSENGLYTVDGWHRFLDRLAPDGVFTVSRWFSPEHLEETGRILSLAVATLQERGAAQPARHIFLASNNNLSTIIVGKAPLSEADLATLREAVARLGYTTLVDPGQVPQNRIFAGILGARSPGELVDFGRRQVLDLSPTWDRNPFFFNQVRLDDPAALLRTSSGKGMVARGNLTATLTLLTLVALSMAFTALVVLLPAARSLGESSRPLVAWGSAYFLLIGFGFMFAEIGLIQRMSIFLGHPVYGLAIVLFGIILATGLGSFASQRLMPLSAPALVGWPLALAAYLVSLPQWLPGMMHAFESADLVPRVMVCLLGILPCGLLMGFMFPAGMRLVGRIDERPTPWFWAINGAAGVLGSGAAVLLSIHTSLDGTLRVAAACYAALGAAAFALLALGRRPQQEAAAVQPVAAA